MPHLTPDEQRAWRAAGKRARQKKRKRKEKRRAKQRRSRVASGRRVALREKVVAGRVVLGAPSAGLVTVLMSAYAAKTWIRPAVKSILSQRLPWGWGLELIIGVDACPETLQVVEQFRDPRVVLVNMKRNSGTYQTLNTLLDHARGSLIAVMDSDDISLQGRLAAEIEALVRTPGIGAVAGYYQNCDPSLQPLREPTEVLCHGASMTRASVYEDLGGYKPWRCGADADFFLRVEKAGHKTALVDRTVLLRRVHPKSLCNAKDTGQRSAARAFAYREIEKERRRPSVTRLTRASQPHDLIRDVRLRHPKGTVGAVLATIPSRSETAAQVVKTLLAQGVKEIVVHLNGHTEIPAWAQAPGVRAFKRARGTGPLVRFYTVPDTEVVLSVDDDIRYPPDYVERTVENLRAAGRRAAISYHASTWPSGSLPRYQDRRTITYQDGRTSPTTVEYIGCGVAAFYGHHVPRLDARSAPARFSMEDDAWVSAAATRIGLELIRPTAPAGWIRAVAGAFDGSLFSAAQADDFRRRDEAIRRLTRLGVWSPGNTGRVKVRPPSLRQTRSRPNSGRYDPETFWKNRYKQTGKSILTVGRRGASVEVNEREYAAAKAALQRMLRRDFGSRMGQISVLDIGYGLGHYAEVLHAMGVRSYLGIDLASTVRPPALVRDGFRFQRGNIADPSLSLGGKFDLVLAIDVLYHIVDPDEFRVATRNIRAHARGLVYITGLMKARKVANHVQHRGPRSYGLGEPRSIARWRDNKIATFDVRKT